jgi:predicted ATPase
MIGRQAELGRCHLALAARGGVGQVLLIAGEAGIGKSRLVRTFLDRAATRAT